LQATRHNTAATRRAAGARSQLGPEPLDQRDHKDAIVRIVHVLPGWQRSGALTCVECLLDLLPGSQFEQHVWALSAQRAGEPSPAVHASRTRTIVRRGTFDLAAAWQLRRAVRQAQADLVHAWDGTLHFLSWALRGTCTPLVAALRHWPASRQRQAQVVRTLSGGMAVCTAVASRSMLAHLRTLGVPATRLHDVPPLVPATVLRAATGSPQRHVPLRLLGAGDLPDDARVVLWAGTLRVAARVEDAIWTADVIQPLVPALHLVLCGDGPHRAAAERFAHSVRRRAHMHFVGQRVDLPAWRAASAAYWHPGADDLASCSLLEALATGLPVLAADTPAHRELIVHGETGLLFPVGDTHAMARGALRLLEDPALAARLGSAARQRAAELPHAAKVAQEWAEFYCRAATASNGRRAARRSA
jgi:glycosyltransferase involved in cell wall biosynthesis